MYPAIKKTCINDCIRLMSVLSSLFVLTVKSQNQCGGIENRYICDASDPQVFYICMGGNKFQMGCPGVLNFNAKSQVCDWPAPNLCPYDGYSGIDKDSYEDNVQSYNSDNYIDDSQYQQPQAVSVSMRENPYTNRVRQRQYNDFNSFGNALDETHVKANYDAPHVSPKASPFRSTTRRTGNKRRRLVRNRRPYNSPVASSRPRTRSQKSRPGRVFSPFSPPLDAYSYHGDRQQVKRNSELKPKRNNDARSNSLLDERVSSNLNQLDSRDRFAASRREMDASSDVPSWLSKEFVADHKGGLQSQPSNNGYHQSGAQTNADNSIMNSKRNHWIDILGLKGMPDNFYNSVSKTIDRQSKNQRSQWSASAQDKISVNQFSKPKEAGQGSQSQQTFHSKNLQQRIYPYRPQGTAHARPETQSYRSKYAIAQHKQGYKPNPVSSYVKSVSKSTTRKGKCSSSWCKLPHCRCVGQDIPGNLPKQEVPMMVMLTFDDGVNANNMGYYRTIFNGSIRNPNGCPIKSVELEVTMKSGLAGPLTAQENQLKLLVSSWPQRVESGVQHFNYVVCTFFVSGDSTVYDMVGGLTKYGHEIASHTLSHRNPTTWWATAGVANWQQEVVGMKNRLAEKSGVPRDSIQGMRAPFLQVGGDAQYRMLYENKFRWDSSMVTGGLYEDKKSPIWPFTLDSPPDGQTCNLSPCPKGSYPGLWEVPLIRWYGNNRYACAMPDACTIGPGVKGSLSFLEQNFNRHYETNKAPLGIFIHASWFKRKGGNFEGLLHFLHYLGQREDVWLVTVSQMLDWMQSPKGLRNVADIPSWQC